MPVSIEHTFPRTRYQGSKRKLAAAILSKLEGLEYSTVLDTFGGTGAVSYAFKQLGKQVTYNDSLRFNQQIGMALIENDSVRLTDDDIATVTTRRFNEEYPALIETTFEGIYFPLEENRWLDTAVANIARLECRNKRALAWFAVFQSALAKRPYNLFHRKNLYMRTAEVPRGFGNKATWDRGFDLHFRDHAAEANEAVFAGKRPCRALALDALDVPGEFDLVYIDPPYINRRGIGVDYHHFYHFLEGMVRYSEWADLIDPRSKHRRLRAAANPWCDPKQVTEAFQGFFARFRDSALVLSYRSDGFLSPDDLTGLLRRIKTKVQVCSLGDYRYALSNSQNREMLFIATD